MDLLERPARVNQTVCEPIEKLWVSRSVPHSAKIVGSSDEPAAEMVLPDPVDDHSCGQRVCGIGDRASQFEPATSGGEQRPVGSGKDLEETSRRYWARFAEVATQGDSHVRVASVLDRVGAWEAEQRVALGGCQLISDT